MSGAAVHCPANFMKATKGLLCKPKWCCWECSPNSHLSQHFLPLPPPLQRAMLGRGLLLVHTIPWQWGGISFHDVYSHKHPGHGQCGDNLMPASDTLLPDGLLGCHTGAVNKQKRAVSVSQHHSALNWHLHTLQLKDGSKRYSQHFLQPKDADPSQDFHHLWAVQLPDCGIQRQLVPWNGNKLEWHWDLKWRLRQISLTFEQETAFFFLLLCSTWKVRRISLIRTLILSPAPQLLGEETKRLLDTA